MVRSQHYDCCTTERRQSLPTTFSSSISLSSGLFSSSSVRSLRLLPGSQLLALVTVMPTPALEESLRIFSFHALGLILSWKVMFLKWYLKCCFTLVCYPVRSCWGLKWRPHTWPWTCHSSHRSAQICGPTVSHLVNRRCEHRYQLI